MTKTQLITVFTLFLIAIACKDFNSVECELEEIKKVGDREPFVALAQYDSLQGQIGSASEYIRNKYALLGLRLRDKALLLHTSDSCIRRLVPYFEKKGTVREKQEVYYYAGSVYRDLKDTPRSLEYFLLSTEFTQNDNIDSLMLRNSYSQLHNLYLSVQDYSNALLAAEKECDISSRLGILDDVSRMHLANAHFRLNNEKIAYKLMGEVLQIEASAEENRNFGVLSDLLYSYSYLKDKEKAEICFNLLSDYEPLSSANYLSLAKYYELR